MKQKKRNIKIKNFILGLFWGTWVRCTYAVVFFITLCNFIPSHFRLIIFLESILHIFWVRIRIFKQKCPLNWNNTQISEARHMREFRVEDIFHMNSCMNKMWIFLWQLKSQVPYNFIR